MSFANDNDAGVAAFEAFLDNDGLLPSDEGYKPSEAKGAVDADAFQDHVQEFDSNGNPIEDLTEDQPDADDVEPGEDEGESEDAGDGTDEGSEADVDVDKLYDIEIDGEVYEVNLPELTSGYLRNEDYVKRTTALEKEYSEKQAAVETREQELIREIESFAVIGITELRQLEATNWAQLKAEDPEGYAQKRLEYFDKRDAVQNQINRKNQISQMAAQAAHLKHQAYLASQTKLVQELIPEFNDAGFQDRLTAYATKVGFTVDEVNNIADARQLLVLEQARKFSEGQTRKDEVLKRKQTQEIPEVLKPAAAAKPINKESQRNKAAVSRLRNEGTIDAAAAAFLQFV